MGVARVEALPASGSLTARVRRLLGDDAMEDRAATEGLRAGLIEYLEGRRGRAPSPRAPRPPPDAERLPAPRARGDRRAALRRGHLLRGHRGPHRRAVLVPVG